MKQDFLKAVTMLESKLATTRNNLVKENAAREKAQKRLENSLQENVTLTLTLKSREKELEGSIRGAVCNCKEIARKREKVRGTSGTSGDYEKGRE
jgi:peptidoglycan hydrolase CwlO-like protein